MARGRTAESTRALRHPALPSGFVMRFALIWLGVLAVLALVPAIDDWMVRATIANVRWSASLAGWATELQGDIVRLRGHLPARVASDCTALLPVTLLWSGILAYPASAPWKVVGLAAGGAALWIYNLLRIFAMFAIDGWNPSVVEFVHVYVWQTVTIVLACALFVAWMGRAPAGGRV